MYMSRDALEIQFDFVVSERSIYIPGSGPRVPDPTPMADHDRNGFIISEISIDRCNYTYIVTWKDKPHLLVSVRPQKIRDYVSARTYEEWNTRKIFAKSKDLDNIDSASYGDKEERTDKPERKNNRKRKLSEQLEPSQDLKNVTNNGSTLNDEHQPVLLSSGRASLISSSDQDLDFGNTVQSTPRIQSAMSIESAQFSESGDKNNSTKINSAQTGQITANELTKSKVGSRLKRPPRRKSEDFKSPAASLSDANTARESIVAKLRTGRSLSRSAKSNSRKTVRSLNSTPAKTELNINSQTPSFDSKASVSYNTRRKKNDITPSEAQNTYQQSLNDDLNSEPAHTRTYRKSLGYVLQPDNEYESEFEYEVEDIIDEKWEQDRKGNGVLFYLVKWKGDRACTWEPEEDIDSNILAEYTAKKIARVGSSRSRRSSVYRFSPLDYKESKEGFKNNRKKQTSKVGLNEIDATITTRKAKRKAMSINMFEPELPRGKSGRIPGDLGDEDEPFQITSSRRSKR